MQKQFSLLSLILLISLPVLGTNEKVEQINQAVQGEGIFGKGLKKLFSIFSARPIEKQECDGFCKNIIEPIQESIQESIQEPIQEMIQKPVGYYEKGLDILNKGKEHVLRNPKMYGALAAGAAAASGLGYLAYKKYAEKKTEEADDQIAHRTVGLPSVKQALIGLGAAATAGVLYKTGLIQEMNAFDYNSFAHDVASKAYNLIQTSTSFASAHKEAIAGTAALTAGVTSATVLYKKYSSKEIVEASKPEVQQECIAELDVLQDPKIEVIALCKDAFANKEDLDFASIYQIIPEHWKRPGFRKALESIQAVITRHINGEDNIRELHIYINSLEKYLNFMS